MRYSTIRSTLFMLTSSSVVCRTCTQRTGHTGGCRGTAACVLDDKCRPLKTQLTCHGCCLAVAAKVDSSKASRAGSSGQAGARTIQFMMPVRLRALVMASPARPGLAGSSTPTHTCSTRGGGGAACAAMPCHRHDGNSCIVQEATTWRGRCARGGHARGRHVRGMRVRGRHVRGVAVDLYRSHKHDASAHHLQPHAEPAVDDLDGPVGAVRVVHGGLQGTTNWQGQPGPPHTSSTCDVGEIQDPD